MRSDDLTDFLDQYVQTALWSSNDESDESGGDPMDENYSAWDIAPEALEAMRKECAAFLSANAEDIGKRVTDAAHDFWLTRNGHGCGFWDGDWPEDIGERLTAASKAFGESYLYVGDDGRIYVA